VSNPIVKREIIFTEISQKKKRNTVWLISGEKKVQPGRHDVTLERTKLSLAQLFLFATPAFFIAALLFVFTPPPQSITETGGRLGVWQLEPNGVHIILYV
jgi:hypothetical protein